MPKCPKCKEEIDELKLDMEAMNSYTVTAQGGQLREMLDSEEPGDDIPCYYCPQCFEVI